MIVRSLCLLLLLTSYANAAVLTTGARTYPIVEESMTTMLKSNIATFLHTKKGQHVFAATPQRLARIERPAPVKTVTPTVTPQTFYYDPTVFIPTVIHTAAGTIVLPGTTPYNPLQTTQLDETLIFYDARVKNQIAWARKQVDYLQKQLKGNVKLILVGGDWAAQSRVVKQRVFFDQGGRIVNQLGITHTPAIVTQEGLRLKIDEVCA